MAAENDAQALLIVCLARLLAGMGHVVVGASSPVPAAASLLAQAWRRRQSAQGDLRVTILGSARHNQFTDGGKELFDYAAQGRMDAFFLGGGQIDGEGNVNLLAIGDYPGSKLRLPGSYGSAYLTFLVPNVILFRAEHSPRVLVPKVDFISAPGTSPASIYRPGGPRHLVTGKAHFHFLPAKKRFALASLHPGVTLADLTANTGFHFDHPPPDQIAVTAPPASQDLALLAMDVADELIDIYPKFAGGVLRSLTGEGQDPPH